MLGFYVDDKIVDVNFIIFVENFRTVFLPSVVSEYKFIRSYLESMQVNSADLGTIEMVTIA